METVRTYWLVGAVCLLALCTVVIWYVVWTYETRTLTVAFLDVGQGDAIFIESPTGKQVLIDGGRGKAVMRELGAVMPFFDRSIDILIATHPDQDHIGGLPFVLDAYEVDYVMRSGANKDTAVFNELTQKVVEAGAEAAVGRRGMVVHLGSGVHLDIVYPVDALSSDTNDASIVARLVYGESEVMLTGDASVGVEYQLVAQDGERLASDILKVGHHGSDTSSAQSFVGFVNPEIAVISAGADNRYGHPHQSVLETLQFFETDIYETENGRIVCTTHGAEWKCNQ